MLRSSLLALTAASLLGSIARAQACSDNQFALYLVDANGTPAPTAVDPNTNQSFYQLATESVYLAFDPTIPSGTYYVHVTDDPIDGFDEVLSENDPMDRFVSVTNNGGVITLSLPFSNNPNPALFGAGLNGVGQSILLAPFSNPTFSVCRFKAWYGNAWDLSNGPENPYLILGGFNSQTAQCNIRSYESFRIGDGTGSDVLGTVFLDSDHDGTQDPGEPGLPGWTVNLVTGGTSTPEVTDANGDYRFEDVPSGPYTVELVLQNGYIATTASSFAIHVCACANSVVSGFGVAPATVASNGHTIGFWRNKNGLALVTQFNILPTLAALNLRNASGALVAPATTAQLKTFLQNANSVNMAYMLSAQLVAMHCNVMVGFVSPQALINDPVLGVVSIQQVMDQAILSLSLYGFTPTGHPERANQTNLKNALDNANNNLNWL